MFASTPEPRTSFQSVKSRRDELRESPFSENNFAMAWLMGCVEFLASAAASANGAPVSDPARTAMVLKLAGSEIGAPTAATSGLPIVSVPVLSKITAVIFPAFSSATPSRIKMPRRAAAFAPAMIAAGVARPIAHGQATIKTAAAIINAVPAPIGRCECQRNCASQS